MKSLRKSIKTIGVIIDNIISSRKFESEFINFVQFLEAMYALEKAISELNQSGNLKKKSPRSTRKISFEN